MTGEEPRSQEKLVVDCSECQFWRVILEDEETAPAEIVVEHGRETGHTLAISQIDE